MTLTATTLVKRGGGRALAREAARTRWAYDIAQSTGHFRVPRVIACNEAAGVLELERLHDLEPMQRLIAHDDPASPIWARMGRILAAVHAATPCDADADAGVELPAEWRCPDEQSVPIHGDFDPGNIFYQRADDIIVVLDWAVTPMFGDLAAVGPRCFDVSFFISGAYFLARRIVRRRSVGDKLNRFLRSYEEAAGERLDRDQLADFVIRGGRLRVERQPKSAMQRMSYRRSLRRLEKFLEREFDRD